MDKDKNPNEVKVTTRDKMLRAWQNSMEMVLDFETYSKEIGDHKEAAEIFARYAEEEAMHAAKFKELLVENQGKA